MGYAVSRGGTFGVVERSYVTEDGVPCLVLRWGPLAWRTPVRASDCKLLNSAYESEARAEAEEWLAQGGGE